VKTNMKHKKTESKMLENL